MKIAIHLINPLTVLTNTLKNMDSMLNELLTYSMEQSPS